VAVAYLRRSTVLKTNEIKCESIKIKKEEHTMANNYEVQELIVEQKKNRTLLFVLIGVGVAIVAAIAAAAVYLSSKNEEGQRRGQVLVEKIKSKLPAKKTAEVEATEEFVEEACECEIVADDAE
jgi:Tfp pilus assembly protein PilN